ncbi:MAG TPA: hypothetical protein VN541_19465 [Tepidisphaeraceae bacterium]|nr:hypothetical protein [Tepidisphaeraceae bacterium]
MSQTNPPLYPQPIPVQPLPYSTTGMVREGRPPLVTAIAILCIVVACLSGITSFAQGGYAFLFYVMSKTASAFATMSATASSPAGTPPASQTLQPGEAGTANNTFQNMLSLDGPRVRELDKLMRAHGRLIFGIDEDTPLTAATIRSAVQSSNPAGPSANAPATFTTTEGKVEIFPDHAVFTDQGGTVLRTSAADNTNSQAFSMQASPVHVSVAGPSGATTQPANTTLTPADVDRVMTAIKRMSPKGLKQPQLKTIRQAISAPNQQLVTPGISTPVTGTQIDFSGNVTITFDGGVIVVGPAGQLISSFSNRAMMAGMASGFGISGTTAALVICEAIASLLLAIYLFIIGILAFRTAGRNGILLKLYAVLKIILAICAGVAIPWIFHEFVTGMTRNVAITPVPPSPSLAPFVGWGIGIALLGMALPIGMLIALRAPSVRDYYAGQTMK